MGVSCKFSLKSIHWIYGFPSFFLWIFPSPTLRPHRLLHVQTRRARLMIQDIRDHGAIVNHLEHLGMHLKKKHSEDQKNNQIPVQKRQPAITYIYIYIYNKTVKKSYISIVISLYEFYMTRLNSHISGNPKLKTYKPGLICLEDMLQHLPHLTQQIPASNPLVFSFPTFPPFYKAKTMVFGWLNPNFSW